MTGVRTLLTEATHQGLPGGSLGDLASALERQGAR